MKINTPRSHKKVIVISLIVIAVAVFLAGGYYWYAQTKSNHDRPENSVDYNKPTPVQQAAGAEAKKEFENRQTEASQQSTNSGNNSPTTPSTVTVQITTASVSGSTLRIRTVIPTIDNSGTCIATLTKGGATVTREVKTQTMGSYTTCQGFDIPTAELSSGTWALTLQYSGSEQRSGKATQEVII